MSYTRHRQELSSVRSTWTILPQLRLRLTALVFTLAAVMLAAGCGGATTTPTSTLGLGPQSVSAQVLLIGGLHYHINQFIISDNPVDACDEAHWHAPGPKVFPFETPEQGIEDPSRPQCGFGTVRALSAQQYQAPSNQYDAYCRLYDC